MSTSGVPVGESSCPDRGTTGVQSCPIWANSLREVCVYQWFLPSSQDQFDPKFPRHGYSNLFRETDLDPVVLHAEFGRGDDVLSQGDPYAGYATSGLDIERKRTQQDLSIMNRYGCSLQIVLPSLLERPPALSRSEAQRKSSGVNRGENPRCPSGP